jgi:hypothetical protein
MINRMSRRERRKSTDGLLQVLPNSTAKSLDLHRPLIGPRPVENPKIDWRFLRKKVFRVESREIRSKEAHEFLLSIFEGNLKALHNPDAPNQ